MKELVERFGINEIIFGDPNHHRYNHQAERNDSILLLCWVHTDGTRMRAQRTDGSKLRDIEWDDIKSLRRRQAFIIPEDGGATWAVGEYECRDLRHPESKTRLYRVLYTEITDLSELTAKLDAYLAEHGLTAFDTTDFA